MKSLYKLDDFDKFEEFIKTLQEKEDVCERFGGKYFKRNLLFSFLGQKYIVKYWNNVCYIYVGSGLTKNNHRNLPHFSFTHVQHSTTYPRQGKFLIFGSDVEQCNFTGPSLNINKAFVIKVDKKTF